MHYVVTCINCEVTVPVAAAVEHTEETAEADGYWYCHACEFYLVTMRHGD